MTCSNCGFTTARLWAKADACLFCDWDGDACRERTEQEVQKLISSHQG